MYSKIFDVCQRGDNFVQTIAAMVCNECPNFNLGNLELTTFPSGEFSPVLMESVRGQRVFLVVSTDSAESIIQLQLAIDAAHRSSAAEIIAVIPYFGYARQDRKDARPNHGRSAIGASVIATTLEALKLDRVIIVDLHAEQIQGMFRIPVDHVECSFNIAMHIFNKVTQLHGPNVKVTLASPDAGGVKRVTKVFDHLSKMLGNVNMAFCSKERGADNTVSKMTLIGDVKGRSVFIVDDMIDTAGTLTESAKVIKEAGAEDVNAIATHGIFAGPAIDRLRYSVLDSVVVADTLDHTKFTGEQRTTFDVFSVEENIAKLIISIVSNG